MHLAPSESGMWAVPPKAVPPNLNDDEIDEKYASRAERIVTETNREKLQNFVEALKRPNYMNVRPFYQRRKRWDPTRQSKLIESFIMNIPVPPLFLYEKGYNQYEVMDGQQRITALQAFYSNELVLTGLDRWPELNGRTYSKLPLKVKAGIDRRSIAYIVLLTESAPTDEEAMLLKQLVFERLNTGGVKLTQQEVRNCLYQGAFNTLLIELSKNRQFRKTWELPEATENEDENPPESLLENLLYTKMQDLEIILRFFALRHAEYYQRGMQEFLDLYMFRAQRFDAADIAFLQQLFNATIALGAELYGEKLFRPFDRTRGEWSNRPQKAFADAVLVGLSNHLDAATALRERKDTVIAETKRLFENQASGTFTGRGNTRKDVQERIALFSGMLGQIARS